MDNKPSSCRHPLDVETGTMIIELKCWEGVEEQTVTIWTFITQAEGDELWGTYIRLDFWSI